MGGVSASPIESYPRLGADLLKWYDLCARDLPWRRTQDPYGIWISEIMLQQTRVDVVIERWLRFMERFPRVSELARAQEDEVLAEWAGLGYYRRARAIHAAARVIMEQHDGVFPQTHKDVLDLPGIGPYTAGAITSIGFGQQEALVDGNVERVFARLFQLDEVTGSAPLKRKSWDLARELVPRTRPGDWNQALMELGATVCTPRNPDCEACPARQICKCADALEATGYPRPKPPREVIKLGVECLVIRREQRVLLVRRPDAGRMGGLYELPTREVSWSSSGPPGIFPEQWPAGLESSEVEPLAQVSHTITKHRIQASICLGTAPRVPNHALWAGPDDWGRLGLSGMTSKALSKSGVEIATLRADTRS